MMQNMDETLWLWNSLRCFLIFLCCPDDLETHGLMLMVKIQYSTSSGKQRCGRPTGQNQPAGAQQWTEKSSSDDLVEFVRASTASHIQGLGELLMAIGVFSPQTRISMLGLCREKALTQGNDNFMKDLQRAAEEFLNAKMRSDFQTYEELCQEVVCLVPEDKWMRFVRLHLNFNQQELRDFKREFATLNSEQKLQLQGS